MLVISDNLPSNKHIWVVIGTLLLNPFPNKLWFLCVCSTSLLKTLWEKEKLLVTSNFSFSHHVFYPFRELSAIFIEFEIVVCSLFQFGRVRNLSFGKGLSYTSWQYIMITKSMKILHTEKIKIKFVICKIYYLSSKSNILVVFMPPVSKDRGAFCFTVVHLSAQT